jgi:hypothetical protein
MAASMAVSTGDTGCLDSQDAAGCVFDRRVCAAALRLAGSPSWLPALRAGQPSDRNT